jgi:hypothetical protein
VRPFHTNGTIHLWCPCCRLLMTCPSAMFLDLRPLRTMV